MSRQFQPYNRERSAAMLYHHCCSGVTKGTRAVGGAPGRHHPGVDTLMKYFLRLNLQEHWTNDHLLERRRECEWWRWLKRVHHFITVEDLLSLEATKSDIISYRLLHLVTPTLGTPLHCCQYWCPVSTRDQNWTKLKSVF